MTNDKTVRYIAIGIGLLLSVFVLWFGFRLVQERFSQASTKVANVKCAQDEINQSNYIATFELGSASSDASCEWGLSALTLGSIATGECTGITCKCTMTLVPPGAVPSFKIIVGGAHVGQGAVTDENATPFICEEAASDTAVKTPTQTPTTIVPIPTTAIDVGTKIRSEFDAWTPLCVEKYGALNCARYLPRPDPSSNVSETSSQ